jgi:hypothetical protein
MRKKETVDYTHASGAERRILLGDLQITKGLFTKVKISILCVCVCVLGGRSVLLFCRNASTMCVGGVVFAWRQGFMSYKFTALPDSRTAYVQVIEF